MAVRRTALTDNVTQSADRVTVRVSPSSASVSAVVGTRMAALLVESPVSVLAGIVRLPAAVPV